MNNLLNKDEEFDYSLRPKYLKDFTGQKEICELLNIYISSSKKTKRVLDHVLFYGPSGLGKTTLAYIVKNELGVHIKTTSGPALRKLGDLAAILSTLEQGDILFIDEIHRLSKPIEEMLYQAMEDFKVDIIFGENELSQAVKINIAHFTLIGATTRIGDLSKPLRDRFGISFTLNYYNKEELCKVVERSSRLLGFTIDHNAVLELVKRSRGTPRVANKLLKRIIDFTIYNNLKTINLDITVETLNKLNIDDYGLDYLDRLYLNCLIKNYNGGPVGLSSIAASLSIDKLTIEDVCEPYLLSIGFIKRTKRGRMVTDIAYEHLCIKKEKNNEGRRF